MASEAVGDERQEPVRRNFRVRIDPAEYNAPPAGSVDSVDGPPQVLKFTWLHKLTSVISISVFFFDVVSDVLLALSYYGSEKWLWFALTISFVVVPSLVVAVISVCFYHYDLQLERKMEDQKFWSGTSRWVTRMVFSLLSMGPVFRNVEYILYGLRSQSRHLSEKERRYAYQWMLREDSDACLLRLLESFLESAPQLTLQLYILVEERTAGFSSISDGLRVVALLSSWLSISWSLVSYHKALRYTIKDKETMTISGMIVCFLWRSLEVGPRIIVISFFAAEFNQWMFLPMGIHWLICFTWLQCQELTFFPGECHQLFFNMVCAFIFIFCFLNVKEGVTRYRAICFYFVFLVENFILFSLWFRFTTHMGAWYHLTAFFIVLLGGVLQIFFHLMYYACCHPSQDIKVCLDCDNNLIFESLCYQFKDDKKKSTDHVAKSPVNDFDYSRKDPSITGSESSSRRPESAV